MQPWRFFTKAGHDFMARTVYRLTQKLLLYQAGTRRKLLVDTGAGLTGDTMAAMQPWRFLAKVAHDFTRLSKKPPVFPTKGLQSAARIILSHWLKISHWQPERYFSPRTCRGEK